MGQQMGQQQMPNAQAQRVQQARALLMRTKQVIVHMQSQGQQIPIELQHKYQQQQQMVHAAQAQMAAATARTQQQTLGDTSNTEQYMQNLRNQQALIARMQQRNPQMAQQQGMMNGAGQQQQRKCSNRCNSPAKMR
jgi:transcription factor SPT20